MSTDHIKAYYESIRLQYKNAVKKEKTKILDIFCMTCKINRKYAIRILNHGYPPKGKKPGRKPVYSDIVVGHLKRIWEATGRLCGVRLKAALPLWLPHYECSEEIKKKLLKMSTPTIIRRLKPFRSTRGQSSTKPASLLRTQIPIKTLDWNVTCPGIVEADTVAHCGDSLSGTFTYSVNLTDICTGWTTCRATWGKGWHGVKEQIIDIQKSLPFKIKGFSSDNGGEFLNHFLIAYFLKKRIPFTRSRPYKKNDNAHIEQKNYSHVRHLFGYDRFDIEEIVPLMNDLYKNEWTLYQNFFCPSIKLISKTRIGAKIKKRHDKPQTPYQRLIALDSIDLKTKNKLSKIFLSLNPFKLKKEIDQKQQHIFKLLRQKKLSKIA